MFTRQATQLQSALRGEYGNTPTAQDMIQALCNCAQTIEHRGPMSFSFIDPNYTPYPGISPPPGLAPPVGAPQGSSNPVQPGNTFITFPPWDPIPFDPFPFLPWDPAGPAQFFSGPQYTMQVTGDSYVENIDSRTTQTQEFRTEHITNTGDTYTFGDSYTSNDTYVGGDTYFGGETVHQGPTTHLGPVTNRQSTVHEGPVTNYGDQHHHGQNTFHAPITVIINNVPHQIKRIPVVTAVSLVIQPNGDLRLEAKRQEIAVFAADRALPQVDRLQPLDITVTTDVTWNAATRTFVKTRRDYKLFGKPAADAVDTDVFVAQPAKFDPDTCAIVADNDDPPEYDPIESP
jgi:hypothetical protein